MPENCTSILNALWSDAELSATEGEGVSIKCHPAALDYKRNAPIYQAPPAVFGAVRRVRIADRLPEVALTFDLCEAPSEICGYDGELIDLLRKLKIPSTLFICGKWMRSHPERSLQLISDPSFEIGNHTWDHANLNTASDEVIRDQILSTQEEYSTLHRELCRRLREHGAESFDMPPALPRLLRFPYGRFSTSALRTASELGLQAVQWDVVTEDPDPTRTADAIVRELLTWISPGSIVICHANGKGWNTREALKIAIPLLRERGYVFSTVGQLLTRGLCEFTDVGFERVPEDNTSYDKFGRR